MYNRRYCLSCSYRSRIYRSYNRLHEGYSYIKIRIFHDNVETCRNLFTYFVSQSLDLIFEMTSVAQFSCVS